MILKTRPLARPRPMLEVPMTSPRSESPEPVRALGSWKEIAVYLNRSESTVKRWERERGLPVHRIPGGERGGVYAFATELDAWLGSAEDEATAGTTENGAAIRGELGPLPDSTVPKSSELSIPGKARFAVIGMAAIIAGTGIYAAFVHPFGNWIRQRSPAIVEIAQASSIRRVATPVSDAERSVGHDLYLKGRFQWNQRTPDSLNRALDDFTQAIVHNPDDAHPYAGLADTYEMLFIYGNRQDDDARDRAMSAARKAVEMDNSLSEAHRALGYATWRERNFAEAEKELKLAIQLDPNDSLAHLWLSNVLANQGKDGECLAEITKAQELDPGSASILAAKGDRLFSMGKRTEGIALLKEAVRAEPQLSMAHLYLATAEYEERNYQAYLRESQAAAEIRNDAWLRDVTAKQAAAFARDGERGLLNAEFAVQENCSPPVYRSGSSESRTKRALGCLVAGRRTESLQLLKEASANHEKDFEDLKAQFTSGSRRDLHGPCHELADDPRFLALMKRKADLTEPTRLSDSANSGTK